MRTNDGARVGLALFFDFTQDHIVACECVKDIKAHASLPTESRDGAKNAVMLQIGDQKMISPSRNARNGEIQCAGTVGSENDIFRLSDSEKFRERFSYVKNGFCRGE